MINEIIQGNIREIAPTLETGSVNCIVTSPPYWGLRDYGVAGQIGLEPTPVCGLQGMVRLKRNLSEGQKRRVAQWLLGGAYCDVSQDDTSDKE